MIADYEAFIADQQPDAIFFATNYLAIHWLKACKAIGVPIPAMVSFDDHTLFRLFSPSITAVSQPIEALAAELIHILLNQLDGKGGKEAQQVSLPSQLVIRESSQRRMAD